MTLDVTIVKYSQPRRPKLYPVEFQYSNRSSHACYTYNRLVATTAANRLNLFTLHRIFLCNIFLYAPNYNAVISSQRHHQIMINWWPGDINYRYFYWWNITRLEIKKGNFKNLVFVGPVFITLREIGFYFDLNQSFLNIVGTFVYIFVWCY